MTQRVLFVGRTRYRLPLSPSLERKFAALRRELHVRVLACAPPGSPTSDETFTLVRPFPIRALDGPLFWLLLPLRIVRELRRFRPDAVLAQSPYDAAAALVARLIARSHTRVLVDVHGDWRTATRLYGSRSRRLITPLGDRLALAALRRADSLRVVSGYTHRLAQEIGREPDDLFPAFMDLDPFLSEPPASPPERPQALFVGVLELYKNIDGLVDAWRLAAPRVPTARLAIVGNGRQANIVERLVADLPEQTRWMRSLPADQIARSLDESTLLVLPSRSEGMGRVVVEAMSRGRAVVATRVGGLVELVEDGRNGVLVEPGDAHALADALVRVLTDPELASRLGRAARAGAEDLVMTPEEYASRLRGFVERESPRL